MPEASSARSTSRRAAPAASGRREKAALVARERCEQNARLIARINDSLEVAQSDLSAIGASLGTGVGDLRKDVARLLRDARRDIAKMGTATRRDLEKLQRDLSRAARDGGSSSSTARKRTAPARAGARKHSARTGARRAA